MTSTRPSPLSALLLSAALAGCSGDVVLSGPDGPGDGGDEPQEEQFPEFDDARLVVHSPASAAILFVDEAVVLDAEVVDADGAPLDFDEIVWETDLEAEPIAVGSYGEVDLGHGIHTFTITAELPNGDRLQTVIGGVRVQGRHTGIYSGSFRIAINAEYQGTPITATCVGGLDFVVDMSGETISGENGSCSVNLFVLGEFDIGYAVVGEVDDDEATGDVEIDLGFFALPVGWDGGFDDEALFADFSGGAILFTFDGTLDAHRVSLYVDP